MLYFCELYVDMEESKFKKTYYVVDDGYDPSQSDCRVMVQCSGESCCVKVVKHGDRLTTSPPSKMNSGPNPTMDWISVGNKFIRVLLINRDSSDVYKWITTDENPYLMIAPQYRNGNIIAFKVASYDQDLNKMLCFECLEKEMTLKTKCLHPTKSL